MTPTQSPPLCRCAPSPPPAPRCTTSRPRQRSVAPCGVPGRLAARRARALSRARARVRQDMQTWPVDLSLVRRPAGARASPQAGARSGGGEGGSEDDSEGSGSADEWSAALLLAAKAAAASDDDDEGGAAGAGRGDGWGTSRFSAREGGTASASGGGEQRGNDYSRRATGRRLTVGARAGSGVVDADGGGGGSGGGGTLPGSVVSRE